MAALMEIASGLSCRCTKLCRTASACCHSKAFSQAVSSALKVTMSSEILDFFWKIKAGKTSRRVGNGPSRNSIFMWLARSQSCVSQCFFMFLCCPMKVNSIVILNFHWDLLYIVDMSECEKGSFWEVSVPKTSAAAIFSGDLYIFAKYAPVFSNSAFPTTFASHRHCHLRTYVQMRSFNFCSFSGQDVNWSGTLASTWTLLPHPTPPHPTPAWRDTSST